MNPRHRWLGRLLLLTMAGALIGAFFALGLQNHVTLSALQGYRQTLLGLRAAHPVLLPAGFLLAYVLMAALSIPGALVMTLAGGAIFGLALGTVLISFGATIGATLAMLITRFVLREFVARRLRSRLAAIDAGLARSGWVYLLTLRLVPAIPFVLVNLAFGLTAFPTRRFYLVSQLGMLPATIVYVNAGTQLERVGSVAGILSPRVVISLLLLAALPWAARAVAKRLTRPRPPSLT